MTAQRIAGLILVAVGLFLLLVAQTPLGGEAVPLLVGVAFLIAYARTRNYGLLIPAAILVGLGTGIVVTVHGGPDGSVVLGLGLGFAAITAIDRLVHGPREAQWWPLIPGGILTTIGLLILLAETGLAGFVVPALLVVAGLLLIFPRRLTGIRARHGEEGG
jgi:hypothetical protein